MIILSKVIIKINMEVNVKIIISKSVKIIINNLNRIFQIVILLINPKTKKVNLY